VSEPVACARHTETEALLDIVLGERGGLITVPAAAGTELRFIGTLPAAVIDPAIAGTWRHFKGGVYEFITRVDGAEGELVLYRDGAGDSWLRPLAMVGETVERDGPPEPRFVRVTG
jgi:hypothetical protein